MYEVKLNNITVIKGYGNGRWSPQLYIIYIEYYEVQITIY